MGLFNYGLQKTANLIRDEIGMEKQALNFQALRNIYKNRVSDIIMGAPNAQKRMDLFKKRLNQRNRAITYGAYNKRNQALVDAQDRLGLVKDLNLPDNVVQSAQKQFNNAGNRMQSAINDVSPSDLAYNREKFFDLNNISRIDGSYMPDYNTLF